MTYCIHKSDVLQNFEKNVIDDGSLVTSVRNK